MTYKSTKMSTLSCITMSIGAIIGAGLFTSLPLGITMVNSKVGWAFIAGAIFIIMRTLPSLYLQSALPVSGSTYVYLSRFLHPSIAYIQSLNSIIGSLNIAIMSMTFSNYFVQLFPEANLNLQFVAIVCALTFAAIGTFGARITGNIQNVIVALLIVALGIYIFLGIPQVNHGAKLVDFITPTMDFVKLWGAVAILNYALQGGAIVASFADEVENPRRTIPLSFFIGTGVVTIVYILIAYVTYALGPIEGAANGGYNLGAIASTFMPTLLVKFFIVAGALFATVTTLNGSLMIYSRLHAATARDGIWPAIIAKTNKYKVPYISLWASTIFAIGMMLTGIKLNDILRIVSVPGLLLGIVFYLPPILFVKRFPNAAKKSYMQLPQWLNIMLCVFSVIVSFYMGWSLLVSLKLQMIINMGIFYFIGYGYYILRWQYMKRKHGFDIIENSKKPVPQWEERNSEAV